MRLSDRQRIALLGTDSPLDLGRAEFVAGGGLDVVERELLLQLLLPTLRAGRAGDRQRRLGQRLHVAARLREDRHMTWLLAQHAALENSLLFVPPVVSLRAHPQGRLEALLDFPMPLGSQ